MVTVMVVVFGGLALLAGAVVLSACVVSGRISKAEVEGIDGGDAAPAGQVLRLVDKRRTHRSARGAGR